MLSILETCLYTTDLEAAERFYVDVVGLATVSRVAGRHVFLRCGGSMVLVFDPRTTSTTPGEVGGVPVPAHGTTGAGHVCFAVGEAELEAWHARLTTHGIPIESAITWPNGARSLYVRDPAGNSVEFASPRLWGLTEA
jgi:catechol 2,3-dioxygenase-like lactoylglutathione lyase family enzyme